MYAHHTERGGAVTRQRAHQKCECCERQGCLVIAIAIASSCSQGLRSKQNEGLLEAMACRLLVAVGQGTLAIHVSNLEEESF